MDEEIAKKIGLFRHQVISPVLMDSGQSQMGYFKKLENREFDVPGVGSKKFKASTMKNWLNLYRRLGFEALVPKTRGDKVCPYSSRELRELGARCYKKTIGVEVN